MLLSLCYSCLILDSAFVAWLRTSLVNKCTRPHSDDTRLIEEVYLCVLGLHLHGNMILLFNQIYDHNDLWKQTNKKYEIWKKKYFTISYNLIQKRLHLP